MDRRAQCVHTSAHELINPPILPNSDPLFVQAASPPPLHNAKSRTRLLSINVTLVMGGWTHPRKWPFSVGSVLSSLCSRMCVLAIP